MSNVSNLRCPLTPGLPAIVISTRLVFYETKEWNERDVVKRAVNQNQNEPKPTNQTDQPTNNNNQKKWNNQLNNRSEVQLANIETNCSNKINQQTHCESIFF